jgi:hypothetical protein
MFNSESKSSNLLNVGNLGLSVVSIAYCLAASPAWSAPLQGWRFDPATNQLEVTVKSGVQPRYSLMAQPARIVLDLPDTEVGNLPKQASYDGAVRSVRVSQFQPNVARIVLELAPNVVLAPEQAKLQPSPDANRGSSAGSMRWTLRPLLAGNTKPSAAIHRTVFSSTRPAGTAPSSKPQVTQLPELESSLPPAPPRTGSVSQVQVPELKESQSSSLFPSTTPPPSSPRNSLALSEVNPSLSIPNELPPATDTSPSGAPTVSVPPLDQSAPQSAPVPSNQSAATPIDVPPAERPSTPMNVSPAETAPDMRTPPPAETVAPPPKSRATTIEFGQPLPTQSTAIERSRSAPTPTNFANSTILPTGTRLVLQYPGTEALKLKGNQVREEVLVLREEIRDASGKLIAPSGTPVFGRFETNRQGSRFVARAITLRGQNVPLVGRSDVLSGGRQVSDNRLIRNSGIGALAGAVLGGLSGGNVLGGAAVGAGVTYATSPRPATIRPGQSIPLQLTEDFR